MGDANEFQGDTSEIFPNDAGKLPALSRGDSSRRGAFSLCGAAHLLAELSYP